MPAPAPPWPRKTREMHTRHLDSTVWNAFRFRDDDVVIASYARSGATWTQQIVGQLIFGGDPGIDLAALSPWLDRRGPATAGTLAALEAQRHRRFLTTRLPVDALVFSPKAKYLFIARDGRDVVWSLWNHHARASAPRCVPPADTPGRVGPPIALPPASVREYFHDWLDRDGHPVWPFWETVRSWWRVRELPNVLLVHVAALEADLPGEIFRIAAFLDIAIEPERVPAILAHCGLGGMEAQAARAAPLGGPFREGGAETFRHKGTNGRWRDVLTAADNAIYAARARAELGPEAARWLATGRRPVPAARAA